MDVLIIHYHLNPGGVTKIIESQVNGLKGSDGINKITVICGITSVLPPLNNVSIIQHSRLNYVGNDISVKDLSEHESDILSIIRPHVTRESVIHCHNPNLGKNPALTVALYRLALEGIPVINHNHDFPEDRPANIDLMKRVIPLLTSETVDSVLYPDIDNYHYIVLNSCDQTRLYEKGIRPGRIHLLPNPVPSGEHFDLKDKAVIRNKIYNKLGLDTSGLLCVYPVRAIKRKNIGEFILMAAIFNECANFAITLAPLNPVELTSYNRWKAFCKEQALNIRFEASAIVDYEELVNISDFCITTSIREGFGMVYLEPWLAGTPVIGRELPCVIDDMRRMGLHFPRLYANLTVRLGDRTVDFKDLTQEEQEKVIEEVAGNDSKKQELFNDNSFLQSWLDKIPSEIISYNQRVIRQKFSIDEYAKQILGIYKQISR